MNVRLVLPEGRPHDADLYARMLKSILDQQDSDEETLAALPRPSDYNCEIKLRECRSELTLIVKGFHAKNLSASTIGIIWKWPKKGKTSGILSIYEGQKVGPGCILVPAEHAARILEVLREYKVHWETAQLYVRR